ncbi:MAG: hypothetical protein Q9219_001816 [cf. Caloplaca sp. 3 TL-2023]
MESEESEFDDVPDKFNGFLSLIVPKLNVKIVKQALELHNLLDKSLKITPFVCNHSVSTISPTLGSQAIKHASDPHDLQGTGSPQTQSRPGANSPQLLAVQNTEKKYLIPTVVVVNDVTKQNHEARANQSRDQVLEQIGLAGRAGIEAKLTFHRHSVSRLNKQKRSPLAEAVRRWLCSFPPDIHSKLPEDVDSLIDTGRWTYTIYSPMLLLAPSFLSKPPWPEILACMLRPHLPSLYDIICQELGVSHIAINGPIPALLSDSKSDIFESNLLRLPSNLLPIYGDFGKRNLPATEPNFQKAFWVSTAQNDFLQIWAPLYTMFSKGNMKEKTRLIHLTSSSLEHAKKSDDEKASGSSAVDLYAGIGYFAFSYAIAGVDKVLCWELNGWSIEGLRRGARKNDWTVKVVENIKGKSTLDNKHQTTADIGNTRFTVFHESNSNAANRVKALRHQMPPVRHVNCGYLPSSSDSWDVAVRVLDPKEGGWVHAHENVAFKDIGRRKTEVVEIFKGLVCQGDAENLAPPFSVECQHVERVKFYGPGIVHCVFDIAVLPEVA